MQFEAASPANSTMQIFTFKAPDCPSSIESACNIWNNGSTGSIQWMLVESSWLWIVS